MALRRPPTKIELKAEDIEEYDEIQKERQIAAEEANGDSTSKAGRMGSDSGINLSPQRKRKVTAAERIGVSKTR
eukprot:CAMPEP_0198288034 /NCGR_PEP_ID=MMETSP1449-20131203/6675_1 /TAXON_ID=420275 /ORGANISM="Attheya septentrionalis, Strain CCMP2084" /LENGTH=73 /DNA_ID=CAMNT_0043986119 /DNA_START=207 /DNA_END=428 /DNA_ORIENTATION=-